MSMKFLNTIAVDTDVLYVDTVNDRVGVGTANPTADLHVQGLSAADVPIIRSGGFGNSGSKLELAETLTNGDMNYGFSFFNDGNSSNTLIIKAHNNSTTGTAAITIGRTNALTTFSTVPIVGTRTAGDNSTYAASTAFVTSAVAGVPIGNYLPLTAGSGSPLTGNLYLEGAAQNIRINNGTQPVVFLGDGGANTDGQLILYSSTGGVNVLFSGDNQNHYITNGNVGIGTTSPGEKLHVEGNIRVSGSFKDSSGDSGIPGQILSSTGSSTNWINAVSAPTAPAAPTTVTTTVVGETIEVTFNQSATSNIDYYQVWSADPSGNFGIIAQIAPSDFTSTMTVVDTSFSVSGTMSYRVYAVKLGIYSSAATSTQAFSASALSVNAMTVVNLNTAYYVQYEKPSSRFIDNIEIYMDSQTTQAALNRSNASIVYSGQNASHMRSVGASNNFHQFWVEVTTT